MKTTYTLSDKEVNTVCFCLAQTLTEITDDMKSAISDNDAESVKMFAEIITNISALEDALSSEDNT